MSRCKLTLIFTTAPQFPPFLAVMYHIELTHSRTPFLTAYPCEIWQYSLRSRGVTVGWVSAFAALFFNIFVNAIALDAIGWKYYFFFVAILTIMLITVYLAYPETRGHTLEQMAVIFDKDAAAMPAPAQIMEKAEVLQRDSIAETEQKRANVTTRTEAV